MVRSVVRRGKLGLVLGSSISMFIVLGSAAVSWCACMPLPTTSTCELPIDGGLRVTYAPDQPRAGQPVTFYLSLNSDVVSRSPRKCSLGNFYWCAIYDEDEWFGLPFRPLPRGEGIPGSSDWITWTTQLSTTTLLYEAGRRIWVHNQEPPAVVVFPYAGRFRVLFARSCENRQVTDTLIWETELTGEVVVSVFAGTASGSSPSAPEAQPSSQPAALPVQPSAPAGPSASSPSSSTPASSESSLPAGIYEYGGYALRVVEAIKCASVEERPYTSLLIGAAGGGGFVHLPQVLVDSGADISMFPAWVAAVLGIDLSDAKEVKLGGIGGGEAVGRLARVRIGITHLGGIETNVDGYVLGSKGEPYMPTIAVVFVESGDEFILGRMDVFDLFDLDFTSDTVVIRARGG